MEEPDVRRALEAVGDALVAGNVDGAIDYLSDELRRNLGEVVALLPLPATETSVVSLERATSAFVAVLKVIGETSEVELQTRWKDRDGEPRIVEVSHLSSVETQPVEVEGEGDDAVDGAGEAAST
jgi:hypothetical protein